jgi:transposase-like protein
MSKYICKNCNHDFKQKSHYTRHIYNKKTPCVQNIIELTKIDKLEVLNNKKCNYQ